MNIIHSYIKTPFLVPMVHDSRENKGIERASLHKIAFSCSDGAETSKTRILASNVA